jgi:methylmalonyl-CoA mutase C-terminal domain/subunit
MQQLMQLGVGKLFAPGTDTKEIIDYITNWVSTNRNF